MTTYVNLRNMSIYKFKDDVKNNNTNVLYLIECIA